MLKDKELNCKIELYIPFQNHAKITYDYEEVSITGTDKEESTAPAHKNYFISDLGSQNGTYLNGVRLSPSLISSEPKEILHGSKLTVK